MDRSWNLIRLMFWWNYIIKFGILWAFFLNKEVQKVNNNKYLYWKPQGILYNPASLFSNFPIKLFSFKCCRLWKITLFPSLSFIYLHKFFFPFMVNVFAWFSSQKSVIFITTIELSFLRTSIIVLWKINK